MAANNGIFIRSTKSCDDIIEACNNLLRKSHSNGKIIAVRNDKTYGGVKVYLNGDGIVQELLGKQFLCETGDLSPIYPLITHLTVQDAIFSTTEEEFVDELRTIIQEALGPVLKITKVPISELHPDIGNGNWRVLLDVPEIEDLEVYTKNGLPDQLTVKVPGVHGRLPILFYCSKCKKDGHTQWRCSESIGDKKESVPSSVKDSTIGTPKSGILIRDREEEKNERDATPKNKPMLKRKNMREFESEIGKEEVRNYCDSFQSKDSSVIKKEIGEPSSSDKNSAMKQLLLSVRDDGESNSEKARITPDVDDDSQSENLPKASSTTSDIDIIYESALSTTSNTEPHRFQSPEVGGLATKNTVDDSVSTSNQPPPSVDSIKSELPLTDGNESDSVDGASAKKPVRQRKKPAQGIPIVIPDRIKNIISEMEGGVLDVEQLTAFFNHVKKKSKPCSFAEIYTRNVAGLKQQLEDIKSRYYMIPERGTNAEIQFMKWFVNILDRFEGTPSTRRKR